MIIAGIVAEYNPFHNGHLFQLKKVQEQLNPDLIVVVMSGDFVQRGEPAVVSKWTRTAMALHEGADLIFELPYIYAVGKADIFAGGAVSVLDHLGVTHLVFGSEAGRIEPFQNTFRLIRQHREDYRAHLMDALKNGISYPNAHAAAYRSLAAQSANKDLLDLTQPNNSLGYHYLRAIEQRGGRIIPVTIGRKDAGHNDPELCKTGRIASATSIRDALRQSYSVASVRDKVPGFTATLLEKSIKKNELADWEAFFPFLKYKLLSSRAGKLEKIYEAEEGIEHRLLACIQRSATFHEFLSQVKTKRYTWSRLQRLCVHILTDTEKSEARKPAAAKDADYLRLLGMRLRGQKYLAAMRKDFAIPVVSKIRQHRTPILDLDLKAAAVYDYLSGRSSFSPGETGQAPVRYDEHKGQFVHPMHANQQTD
ncbi:nucleotidyltransferase [Sporolactobacillus vineae]|uniref:nucleotidyltransferase n=1 Tax=Sporolactobacillus vineae TaxID=444463 RepID=UPI00028861FB|nr:nucleotidyltransferase [Sporolactobacillus vineae]